VNAQRVAPRTCPVCGHQTHPNEPGQHNCTSVLRERLHQVEHQLQEMRARNMTMAIEIDMARDLTGAKDLKIGICQLLVEIDQGRSQVLAAYSRGLYFGHRLTLSALRPLRRWPPLWRSLQRRAQGLVEQAEDRKAAP